MTGAVVQTCPLCRRQANVKESSEYQEYSFVDCKGCGSFELSEKARVLWVEKMNDNERARLSAFTRERTIRGAAKTIIVSSLKDIKQREPGMVGIEDVEAAFPKSVAERLDRTLLNLRLLSDVPGTEINLAGHDYPLAYAESADVMQYAFRALREAGLIRGHGTFGGAWMITLTVEGWDRIVQIERRMAAVESTQAFVAMWFTKEMDEPYNSGIKKAVQEAGYEPVKVDLIPYNDKIDDRIIAEIRKSRFLIADMTGQRQGVYFEAGFAKGLNIPVIWTCREDCIEGCHFDTRQYNHIVWKSAEDLYEKMLARIEATLGRA